MHNEISFGFPNKIMPCARTTDTTFSKGGVLPGYFRVLPVAQVQETAEPIRSSSRINP